MEYKLSPEHRAEVNALIEQAQEDLEAVLFRLVADRERARKDSLRMDWMADSYGAAGMTLAEAEAEARAYEKAYAEAKRRGMPDRVAVRAAVDVALALANTEVRQAPAGALSVPTGSVALQNDLENPKEKLESIRQCRINGGVEGHGARDKQPT